MNRLILSLALLGTSLFPAAAQHYRGFLDATFAYSVRNSSGMKFGNTASAVAGTTSHGVQLRNLFIGAGAGVQYALASDGSFASEGVGIPVFADVRYDFFNTSVANLFIGCKLGYSFATKNNYIHMANPSNEWVQSKGGGTTPIYHPYADGPIGFAETWIYQPYSKFQGLYIQPSIGVRFRLNETMGMNLTLSYIPLQMNYKADILYSIYHYEYEDYGGRYNTLISSERHEDGVTGKFWSHHLAISVGIDF